MIANRYNQLLNNFKKIKLTANNNKKSLENIADLKKEFLKIKDYNKQIQATSESISNLNNDIEEKTKYLEKKINWRYLL